MKMKFVKQGKKINRYFFIKKRKIEEKRQKIQRYEKIS